MYARWGVHENREIVSNVVGLPGLPTQREVTYTLDELADEVVQAVRVAQRFTELSTACPVYERPGR